VDFLLPESRSSELLQRVRLVGAVLELISILGANALKGYTKSVPGVLIEYFVDSRVRLNCAHPMDPRA
jgi:hypothetical protein